MKNIIKKFVPGFCLNWYHWFLAFLGGLIYGFPSRKIFVLGVTGTKGKTSVIELASVILEQAGFKTALSNSLRFKIGKEARKNTLFMTMPGRFLLQRFFKKAVRAGCQYALIEVTSEGILQSRHKFVDWDTALFTNLSPEHIESHGSFENYRNAKIKFFNELQKSRKDKKTIIVNGDDESAELFLKPRADKKLVYSVKEQISDIKMTEQGTSFILKNRNFHTKLIGKFNLYNILAAIVFSRSQNIGWDIIERAIRKFKGIPGRMEFIQKEPFKVVVDYVHTPDSLEQVYETLQGGPTSLGGRTSKLICVFGSCGGGRDKWKRPELGRIAAKNCQEIILTDEDPFDENPKEIINQIEKGVLEFIQNQDRFSRKEIKIKKTLDRREAIHQALKDASPGDVVAITGKGAEPWIMGPRGSKIPWDDKEVAREELAKLPPAGGQEK